MEKTEILELVDFFNQIEIEEKDITTDEQKSNDQLVLEVTYKYQDQVFVTKPLFYKKVSAQNDVKKGSYIIFFGNDPFWLDISIHHWPQPSGKNKDIIDYIGKEDTEFKDFLDTLIKDDKMGKVQKITKEGQPSQYGQKLINNNHCHDLIKLIKAIIKNKGNNVGREHFSRLVFQWDKDGRTSLHPHFGERKIIADLYKNIKSIQKDMQQQDNIKLLEYKKQIILQGPPGTGKTYTAKDMAFEMVFEKPISSETDRKIALKALEKSEQFKLIQFHPAYTYEDFVRGIIVETKDGKPEYITKNKVLGEFAAQALKNWEDNQKTDADFNEENKVDLLFNQFKDAIQEQLEELPENEKLSINKTAYFTRVEDFAFRYTGDNWNSLNDSIMKFSDLKNIYLSGISEQKELKKLNNVSGTAKQNATYTWAVVSKFKAFVEEQGESIEQITKTEKKLKKYILIIDEINRANLPAVLGELIYALEYRDEAVESMYELDDTQGRNIVLPSNLYIIGTMNTADRSVSHIDYAIRRRFAFIDVLPNQEVVPEHSKALFNAVKSIFDENISGSFKQNDVQLGHSYFMGDKADLDMKLNAEIKPILLEYVKDGILNESAITLINDLHV